MSTMIMPVLHTPKEQSCIVRDCHVAPLLAMTIMGLFAQQRF